MNGAYASTDLFVYGKEKPFFYQDGSSADDLVVYNPVTY